MRTQPKRRKNAPKHQKKRADSPRIMIRYTGSDSLVNVGGVITTFATDGTPQDHWFGTWATCNPVAHG